MFQKRPPRTSHRNLMLHASLTKVNPHGAADTGQLIKPPPRAVLANLDRLLRRPRKQPATDCQIFHNIVASSASALATWPMRAAIPSPYAELETAVRAKRPLDGAAC